MHHPKSLVQIRQLSACGFCCHGLQTRWVIPGGPTIQGSMQFEHHPTEQRACHSFQTLELWLRCPGLRAWETIRSEAQGQISFAHSPLPDNVVCNSSNPARRDTCTDDASVKIDWFWNVSARSLTHSQTVPESCILATALAQLQHVPF